MLPRGGVIARTPAVCPQLLARQNHQLPLRNITIDLFRLFNQREILMTRHRQNCYRDFLPLPRFDQVSLLMSNTDFSPGEHADARNIDNTMIQYGDVSSPHRHNEGAAMNWFYLLQSIGVMLLFVIAFVIRQSQNMIGEQLTGIAVTLEQIKNELQQSRQGGN